MEEAIHRVAELIVKSKHLMAFSGAGLSQESGIPTFRGDEGIWTKYLPIIYGNPAGLASAFVFSPGKFRDFILDALGSFTRAKPNAGHIMLGELSAMGVLKALVTQNIDDLEHRAGVKEVIQLHGNVFRMRCSKCEEVQDLSEQTVVEVLEKLKKCENRKDLIDLAHEYAHCHKCGGWARPDIVLFGEAINKDDFYRAVELARASDVMLVLGTSGVVYPAALIPGYARKAGATIIEINPEDSEISKISDLKIRASSASTLPSILEEMRKLSPELFADKKSL